ncbi:hypothetical protein JCM33374_g5778 [Metschnikowia sp. JCM 33374]|nr:hypothetical protein JCM33374_g5778 [Metschnikowia sp. JCM 33374]
MNMESMNMATSTAMSAMSTMTDMAHGHSHATGTSDGMDMSGHSMDMMSMNMYLTTNYMDYPVLFKGLSASTAGQAFGIFVLFFFASFLSKGFEFTKNYLESKVWQNPNYQIPESTTIVEECGCDDDNDKTSDAAEGTTPTGSHKKLSVFTVLTRDCIRIILCFLSELFGYAMMLVAMTFSLVYFFAVVLGMAFGRFFFERLSDKLNVRPGGNNFQGHH